MADLGADQEFIPEEIQKIIDDENEPNQQITIMYTKEKVSSQCQQIIDYCIRGLSKLGKPFKYCVTCILQQHNEAGMSVSAGGYYDNNTDGFVNCEKEINDIVVLVSVFAMFI